MIALGFRSVKVQEQAPKPPPHGAWVSVRLIRNKGKGPVTVLIGDPDKLAVGGTIAGSSSGNRLMQFFLHDQGRFPTAGGFSVEPEKSCQIKLQGIDEKGAKIESSTWGPYQLASGAMVDIELSL